MYFIWKLKLDVSTQDNINAAFFKYTCFKTERKQGTVRGQTPKVDQFRCAKTRAT